MLLVPPVIKGGYLLITMDINMTIVTSYMEGKGFIFPLCQQHY